MTRRAVLKGIAALSTALAIAQIPNVDEELTNVEKFQRGMEKGILDGLTFRFTQPIDIINDDTNLMITNCRFEFDLGGANDVEYLIRVANPVDGALFYMTDNIIDRLDDGTYAETGKMIRIGS